MSDEILGVFVYPLTSDGYYPVQGCEKLQLSIEMQLSEKRKSFFPIFVPFLDSTSNFEQLGRKDDRHS